MLIRLGYEIGFQTECEVPMVALLHVHPSRIPDLVEPDSLSTNPALPLATYQDVFGNICTRLTLPVGKTYICNSALIHDAGLGDEQDPDAREVPVAELPSETLQYLLSSRYCEVDLLGYTAGELFGQLEPGYRRVQAICDWVYSHVTFGYQFARSTKTALDVYTERLGVCRDFQHLAITFCRCLNIPARYVTGYLGDIGVPPAPTPMDFSAWFEAYLGGRWWTFDARHNCSRQGRVLMAVGRDAADVAITTSFGSAKLIKFDIVTDEVKGDSAGMEAAVEPAHNVA